MLKPIFDEDVDFFSKKIILCAKGGDFKNHALDSDFMFVNIEPYKSIQRNVSHIKLSKYCDIDARLTPKHENGHISGNNACILI